MSKAIETYNPYRTRFSTHFWNDWKHVVEHAHRFQHLYSGGIIVPRDTVIFASLTRLGWIAHYDDEETVLYPPFTVLLQTSR
jgi:hypothetical protein